MGTYHIEMEEDYKRLTEEEFLAEYGQANYEYIKELVDPEVTEEDMTEEEVAEDPKHTTFTGWTELDHHIHEKEWSEWNRTIK